MGQHRIEKRAGYVDAVGAHHLEVELEVVADFFRGAFKKGPHRFQVFRTGDGQVPGFVGFGAEGDAQQGVRHRIQTRRFRVETPGIVPVQFRDHGVAGLLRVRDDVFVPDVVHGFQLALFKQFHLSRSRLLRRGGRDGSLPRLGGSEQIVCGKGGGRSGGRNLPAKQLGLHGAELQFLKEAQQFVRPGLLLDKLVKGYGQGHVPVNGGKLLGKGCQRGVLLHDLPALSFQLVRICQQVFHGAEFPDQQLGRFLPHAGQTRNIVGAVAHQGQDVDHLLRPFDAPLFLELFQVNHLVVVAALAGPPQVTGGGNKLAQVLVLGNHVGVELLRIVRDACQRAYRIVRLISLFCEDRNTHGRQDFLHKRYLLVKLLRHRFSCSLVGVEHLVAERRRF